MYEITEELSPLHTKKKRRERAKYIEINGIVDELVKHTTSSKSKINEWSTNSLVHKKEKCQVSCTEKNKTIPPKKSILKGLLTKKLPLESHRQPEDRQDKYNHRTVLSEEKNKDSFQNQHHKDISEMISKELNTSNTDLQMYHSPANDTSLQQCNILLDLFKHNPLDLEMDTELSASLHCSQQSSDTITSPITETTNMLDISFQKSDEQSLLTNSMATSSGSTI
jgi:hypothetical protein